MLGALLSDIPEADLVALQYDWQVWARDDQLPPPLTPSGLDWRVWLVLGGRGSGKTRAGAEFVRGRVIGEVANARQPARVALVGETLGDVRRVMVEGVSGLLNIHPPSEQPHFEPSKQQIIWPNGAIAQLFSAEQPDALRGPQFTLAWCDEIAKWRQPQKTWDMLQFALRIGDAPQIVATTTPRSTAFVKVLIADPATVTSRSMTADNAENLAPAFVAEMARRYAGQALGRQELDGEVVDDIAGSLWRREWIDAARSERVPELMSIVVAVDPPVTATASSDACGIIVAGRDERGRGYVIDDRTCQGRTPEVWAKAVIAAYKDYSADRVVAETNQGGDLVVSVLRQFDDALPVRKVHATRGKWLRAEPVAALYAEGRVSHVGRFEQLEDQMALFGADGFVRGRSPDRVDALVWALTDLMIDRAAVPGMRRV